jgi:predicted dehydrogenase
MVEEARCKIRRGEIGDIRVITGFYLQDWLMYDTDYSWRLEPETAGNSCCIADIGSHWMDAVQHVTGHRITEVCADLATVVPVRKKPKKQTETFSEYSSGDYEPVKIENEEYGAALFRTDKGARGVFHASELAAGHGCYFGFEINGSSASLSWNQEENDRLWIGRRGGDNSVIIRNPSNISPEAKPYTSLAMGHPEGWNDAFRGNIYAFYKYIADGMKGEPVFSTLDQAAYIVKLTEAIIKSGKNRTWESVE